MKVFVSGQIEDYEDVRQVQPQFIKAGHSISHDWTTNETGSSFLATAKQKIDNRDESSRRAFNDIQGVVEADVYVICTNNKKVGKGMYVELGAALGLFYVKKAPKVYLLGEMNHLTIFYLHPAIKRVKTVNDIIADIE